MLSQSLLSANSLFFLQNFLLQNFLLHLEAEDRNGELGAADLPTLLTHS